MQKALQEKYRQQQLALAKGTDIQRDYEENYQNFK